jgi:hypothetical protein
MLGKRDTMRQLIIAIALLGLALAAARPASAATDPHVSGMLTTCGSSPLQTIKKVFGFTNSYKGQGAAYSYAINPHGLVRGQQCDLVLQAGVDTSWHAGKFTA